MPNTTTMTGFRSANLETSGASQSLALEPDRAYSIRNFPKDGTGAASSSDIKIEFSKKDGSAADAAVATYAADTDNIILATDDSFLLPRGLVQIKYIAFGVAPFPELQVAESGRHITELGG